MWFQKYSTYKIMFTSENIKHTLYIATLFNEELTHDWKFPGKFKCLETTSPEPG